MILKCKQVVFKNVLRNIVLQMQDFSKQLFLGAALGCIPSMDLIVGKHIFFSIWFDLSLASKKWRKIWGETDYVVNFIHNSF